MKKKAYILAGPNGSGKTTLAKEMMKDLKLPFVNADEIALRIGGKDMSKVRLTAGKLFFKEINEHISMDISFILETTLSGGYLRKIIEKLRKSEYRVELIYIFVETVEEAIGRVGLRVQKGGHFISEEDIKRRFVRSKKRFWNEYRKLVDEWKLILNSKDEFLLLGSGQGTESTVLDEMNFQIFKEGIE